MFRNRIMVLYKEENPLIKKRSLLLYVMNGVILSVILPLPLIILLVRGDFLRPFIIGIVPAIGTMISLLVLMRGKYFSAANVTSLTTSVAIVIGIYLQFSGTKGMGYSSMVYLMPAGIVFSSLFCSRVWTTGIALFFFISNCLFYYLNTMQAVIEKKILFTGFVDSSMSIIFCYALSFLIVKIMKESMQEIQEESDKNKQQYITLKQLVGAIQDASSHLMDAVVQMRKMTTKLSEQAQSQAASVEEVTSAIEEVNASMDMVSQHVKEQTVNLKTLDGLTSDFTQLVEQLKATIDTAAQKIYATAQQSQKNEKTLEELNTTMHDVGIKSQQMNSVADVIDSIAEQISLLALNASIEAARAGEAGRGFAVVADEISKLSDQTSQSLKEIYNLIRETESQIQKGIHIVQETVTAMSIVIGNVGQIADDIQKISEIMQVQAEKNKIISNKTKETHAHADEINYSASEQMVALGEVAKSISMINEYTQDLSNAVMNLVEIAKDVDFQSTALMEKIRFVG
ncbi:MAG: methyl-accepting chemotaxis protein [Spirochaetes bacterium]|nr:methyl-accepting chemotaxis protein [Spirochaetota bacterium]